MRKTLLVFFLFIVCQGFADKKPLSLKECLELSYLHSKKREASEAQVFLAKANKNKALSPLLPQLSIDGKY